MSKKIKITISLFILSLVLIVASVRLAMPKQSYASKFVGEIMNESFVSDSFSTDNWRLVEDATGDEVKNNVSVEKSKPFVVIKGGTYDASTAVYIDTDVQVQSDTGELIVEFDIVNTSNYASMFSVVTGMQKNNKGAVEISEERRSQLLFTGPGGNLYTSWGYGLPGFLGVPAQFSVINNSTNYGAASPVGGYGQIGYRVKLVYSQNGSFKSYRYKINENGSYGSEEQLAYVLEGMLANKHSGYVGFFFWAETIGVNLRNVEISTKANSTAQKVVVFSDTCLGDTLNEKWKTINGNDQVYVSRSPGKVVFDNPTDNNYLVTAGSKNIEYDAVYDSYIVMNFDLEINQLTGKRQFGVAYGLNTSSDNTQTEGVVYLNFGRNVNDASKIDLSWTKIVKGEIKKSNVVTLSDSSIINKTLKIEVNPYVNGKVDVKINGTKHTFAIEGEKIIIYKRLAFIAVGGENLETDIVKAKISDVKITNTYDLVPNDVVDLAQGFDGVDEKGNPWYDRDLFSFGGGLGYTKGDLDAGVFMEDGQLVFRNAGHNSYFSPAKEFGDFLLQFDITDIAREDLYSQDGTLYRPFMRSWLGITFGLPSPGSPYTSGYLLYITPMYEEDSENPGKYKPSKNVSPFVLLGPNEIPILSGVIRHNLIDTDLIGKDIVVRLKADAGVLSFSYYIKGEESMDMLDQPVFTYNNNNLGFGHKGYFGITCTSGGESPVAGDFKIDNFVLKSLDRNINISNDKNKPVVETQTPTNPEAPKDDLDKNQDADSGCNSTLDCNVCIFIISFTLLLTSCSYRKRKNKNIKQ